ncbi:MAG: pentapeptide repeat-containing protein [Scytonematopsis contorta HA4267-MV1]|jgi:uncharacterized protein YjbI with pentapeptide repeats|nr:pentapeptide repeat-containing protein [Scytonematopsis contorta HA4267-MV1]
MRITKSELLSRYADGERQFQYVDLIGLDLSGVDLSRGDFAHALIRDTNLRGANLRFISLCDAIVERCDFSSANFEEAVVGGFFDTNLSRANFDRCRFMSLGRIVNCNLEGATFRNATLKDFSIEDSSLQGANLEGMTGWDFTLVNVNLMGIINFVDPAFDGVYLHNTILPSGRLQVEWYGSGDIPR